MPGSGASVSSIGTAGTLSQQVKIEVPPFHGLEPSLGLVYDSADGNSVAGVGWRMSGLSSIQRSSPGRGAPRYGPGDVFYLDGIELLPCTPAMTSPSCRFPVSPDAQAYVGKIENFERIAYFPGPDGGQWKVWAKTGTVSTYQPRQPAPGKQVFAWDLASVSDTIGNRVDYRWWPDPAASQAGQSYLDSVVYGDATVKLRYQTRPDPFTYANGATLVAVRDRLESIEVRVGTHTARVYQLDYATSTTTGRSLLKQVQQFGDDAVVCTDTTSVTCAYGRVKSGSALAPATIGAASMAAGNGTWQPKTIPLGAGTSPVIGPPWPGQPYDSGPYQTSTPWLQHLGSASWQPKSRVADVNGDGRDDVVVLRFLKDKTGPTDKEVLSTAIATRNGYVFKDFEPDPTNRDPTIGVHEDFLLADADGDGMADVMQITNDNPATPENEEHLQVWRSNGDGTYARTADQAVSWPYESVVASCRSFNVSAGIAIPTPIGIFSVGASWNIYSSCNIDLESQYFVADINGDGRADFIGASHTSTNTVTLHTALSTGTGFTVLPDITTNWRWSDTNTKRDRFFPADINGDGKADIVHVGYNPVSISGGTIILRHSSIDVALSHGNGAYTLIGSQPGSSWPWDDEDVWYPGNVNGDGRTDVIDIFRKPSDAGTPYDHGGFRVGLSYGTGAKFRWVSGNTTFPWYRPAPSGNLNKYPTPWMVGDVDGDGRSDIVSVSDVDSAGTPSQNLAVVFAGAGGTFTTNSAYRSGIQPTAWPWQPPDQVPVHLADLNGDGKSDLLFTPWRGPGLDYPLDLIGYLSPNRGLDTAGWHPADINGDGRSDLVYIYFRNPGYTVYTLIAKPDGSYKRVEDTVDFANMPGAIAELNTPDTTGWMVADVGGGPGKAADGRADLVYVDHVANKRLTVYSLISDGTGHYRHQAKAFLLSYNGEFPAEWQPRNWITADVNGDGRTDLVNAYHELGEARVHTLLSEGDGDWTWSRSAFFTGLAAGDGMNWQTGDINGDGRADLMMAAVQNGITTVRSLLANGNGTWRPVTKVAVNSAGASPGFPDTRRWMVIEANSDGMADLGYIEYTDTGVRVHTLTSIGDGTFMWDKSPVLAAPHNIDVSDVVAFKRADTNADGLTDLVHVSTQLNPKTAKLETAVILITNQQPNWAIDGQPDIAYAFPDTQNWHAMDRDGDGRTDLAYIQTDLQTLRLPAPSDMVNHVTSPMGAQSQISYAPSSTWDANQANSRCHLPLGVVREGVRSITTSDGRPGSSITVSYAYSCAAWSDTERGFLGWKEVYEYRPSASNQPSGTTLVRYDLSDTCFARPEYRQTYDDSGAAFEKSTIDYLPTGTTAPYRCLVNSTNNITLNQQAAAPNDHTYYTYDDFGNVTSVLEQADPGTTGDERFTSRTFHPETSSYIVGLPAGEQVNEGRDSSGPVLRTRMYCYDGDTSLTCTQPPSRGLLTARHELNLNGLADLAVTKYAYDAVGNLAAVQDPNGNTSQLFYDAARIYPTLSCNAAQQCQDLVWDAVTGQVTSMKDANGRITRLAYDPFGRLTTVSLPGRGQYTRSYLDWGKPTGQRVRETFADGSADGLWREMYLDGLGRTYRETQKGDQAGETFVQDTSYAGPAGLPYRRSDWRRSSQSPVFEKFEYDAIGRPLTQTHPDGAQVHWQYSANADTTWVKSIDELGQERRTFSDALGRTVRISEWADGKPAEVSFTYNGMDELKTSTDPGRHVTVYNWDNRGRQISIVDPDRGNHSWTYDLNGNVLTHTDGRNLTITYTYDALNRVKTETDPDSRLLTWNYDEPGHPDSIGRLTSVTDSRETSCPGKVVDWFGYDVASNPTRLRQCTAGMTVQIGTSYDSLNRQKTLTYPDGQIVSYHYDAAGRLHDVPGLVESMHYDAAGRLTSVDYANGTQTTYDIDPQRGWLKSEKTTSPTATLYQVTYQHLANGAIKSSRSPTNAMNLDYTYDTLNRLHTVSGDITQTLNYDVSGNITYNSALGYYTYPTTMAAAACGQVTKQLCPNAVSSVSSPGTGKSESYRYDNDGNLTLATRTGAGGTAQTRSIEWNADNKPVVITDYNGIATNLRYGPFGNRTYRERAGQVTVSLGSLVDQSFPVAGGAVTTTKNYYAGPLHIASSDGSGITWNTTDQQETTRLHTNQQSAATDRPDYTPFGSPLGAGSANSSDRGFIGQRNDKDNGLLDLNARYYDAQLGRFISADPALSAPTTTQSFNPYSYAENNPISLSDPSGLCVAAQETCFEFPQPQAPVMGFEAPPLITGEDAPLTAPPLLTGEDAPLTAPPLITGEDAPLTAPPLVAAPEKHAPFRRSWTTAPQTQPDQYVTWTDTHSEKMVIDNILTYYNGQEDLSLAFAKIRDARQQPENFYDLHLAVAADYLRARLVTMKYGPYIATAMVEGYMKLKEANLITPQGPGPVSPHSEFERKWMLLGVEHQAALMRIDEISFPSVARPGVRW